MSSSPPRKPNRYELPLSNMVGAMVIVVLFVLAFVVFRAVNRDNKGVQAQTVDYHPLVAGARADGRLQIYAPPSLPDGWSVRAPQQFYSAGLDPHWHLGITDGSQYLGIEEGIGDVNSQLTQAMQGASTADGTVSLKGIQWAVYTDAHGDYALTRTFPSKTPQYAETLVVVGTTPPATVQAYAASLTTS